jgi:alkylation response protein AidB-like acyl-CoA dehydrogenase
LELILSKYHLQRQKEFKTFADSELDQDHHFPHQNLKKAGNRGYMGLPIPREWGGAGEDFLTYILMLEEVSRVCASTGVILSVHTSVGSFPLLYFGTVEQKNRFLPNLASGKLLGAFALTETGAGSDAAALAATATAVEEGYLLNGSKLFITGGGEADLFTVFATVDRSMGRKGITAFLVEKDCPGLTAGPPERKMGLNRSHTAEIRMEDLFVPASNRLGDEGAGFTIAMSLLDGGRIGIAAQGLGLARAALEFTTDHLKQQENAGLKTEQSSAFIIADLAAKAAAARLLIYRAAMAKQSGKRCTREASMAKLMATDLAMEATTKCIDLCQSFGCGENNPVTRFFCDAKAPQIYEGSNQIQRIVVARELLNSTS